MINEISPIDRGWHVLFSFDDQLPPRHLYPCIVIKPWGSGWNDFGFKTDCDITIFKNDSTTALKGKVAFRSMRGSVNLYLKQFLEHPESKNIREKGTYGFPGEALPEFYTMLTNLDDYRTLVHEVSFSGAKQVLDAINDMAFAKARKIKAKWFLDAQRERAFTDSFIRSAEAFFAFNNASFLVYGLKEERLDVVSSALDLSFQLEEYANPHRLHFTFAKDSVIPKNIAVIIGENGVGKSQALSRLVGAALADDRDTLSEPGGARPMISQILAMATPGETAHTFPTPPRSKRQRIGYRRLSLSRGSTGSGADGLPDLLQQLSRQHSEIRSKRRWNLFVDALKTVMEVDALAFRLHQIDGGDEFSAFEYRFPDVNFAGLADFDAGGEAKMLELRRRLVLNEPPRFYVKGKLYPMSSGQIAFFRFALHACLYIENGTLVLLDEPETHLHPNLISDFSMLLNSLLTETGSIAIITTHSAYFVREVPKSQVFILRATTEGDSKYIHCDKPRLGTFGSNVAAISHFVFADELSTSLMRLVEKRLDAKSLHEIKDDISLESYMKVRDRLAAK